MNLKKSLNRKKNNLKYNSEKKIFKSKTWLKVKNKQWNTASCTMKRKLNSFVRKIKYLLAHNAPLNIGITSICKSNSEQNKLLITLLIWFLNYKKFKSNTQIKLKTWKQIKNKRFKKQSKKFKINYKIKFQKSNRIIFLSMINFRISKISKI